MCNACHASDDYDFYYDEECGMLCWECWYTIYIEQWFI